MLVTARGWYAAFFDASGKPKPGDVLFVSGFIATENGWSRFERQWAELMKSWGIKRPFHTTHYVRGEGSDYTRFRNNDRDRAAFEATAVRIIKDNTNKPVSFGLPIDAYTQVSRHYAFSPGMDRPYGLAGFSALAAVAKWARKQEARGRFSGIRIIFEDGDDDRRPFSDAIMRVTGLQLKLGRKEEYPPLVTRDILAWRHARLVKRGTATERGHPCFAGLLKHVPSDSCRFLDAAESVAAAKRLGRPVAGEPRSSA